MEAWKRVEQAVERARLDIIELDRRMLRLDARVEGLQGHVEKIYQITSDLAQEAGSFRDDMQGFRAVSAAVTQQMSTTTKNVLAAFESLSQVSSLLTTVLEQVAQLTTRVEALEKNKEAA